MSKIYILILNYNNSSDTIGCLDSIYTNCMYDFEILLMDNDSNDDSVCILEKYIKDKPHIRFFALSENLGYAGGNNVGLRYALEQPDMEYCWILNNDTVVEKNSLESLYEFMQKHSDVGICGSKMIYEWDRSKLQGYGGFYNRFLSISRPCLDIRQIDKINYVIGASVFIRRKFLEDIGLMCEDYFLYCEEIDWAERAKGKYKIACEPKSVVYHKEGAATGGSSKTKTSCSVLSDYYQIRSRLLFAKKYYKKYLPIVYLSMLMVIFNRIKRGQFDRIPMIIRLVFGLSDNRFK